MELPARLTRRVSSNGYVDYTDVIGSGSSGIVKALPAALEAHHEHTGLSVDKCTIHFRIIDAAANAKWIQPAVLRALADRIEIELDEAKSLWVLVDIYTSISYSTLASCVAEEKSSHNVGGSMVMEFRLFGLQDI